MSFDRTLIDSLEAQIIEVMRLSRIPGLGIAILKDNAIFYMNGFGSRNLQTLHPFTPHTYYGVGSTSKIFAAIAIMQLQERGLLSIHDPVSKYIPFPASINNDSICIKHVLSHTTGIPDLGGTMNAKARTLGRFGEIIPMGDTKDFFFHITGAQSEIKSLPGKKFFYNNDIYQCLAYIIEKISNQSYPEYVKAHIFDPLHMERSTYLISDITADTSQNASLGYIMTDPKVGLQGVPFPFNKFDYANGGLVSCVDDLVHIMQCLNNLGEWDGHRILNASSLQDMWQPRISPPEMYASPPGGYGLGFMIEENFCGERIIHHSGNVMMFSGHFMFIPAKQLGIIIGINSGNFGTINILARSVLSTLLGKIPVQVVPELKYQKFIEKIQGKYSTYKNMARAEIYSQDGALYLKVSNLGFDMLHQLVVEDMNQLKFFVPLGIYRLPVQFLLENNDHTLIFTMDRFQFHKRI